MNSKFIYEVAWGGSGVTLEYAGGKRFFPQHKMVDALVMIAHKIVALDADPLLGAAWAQLSLIEFSENRKSEIQLGWTKCSNERPTTAGFKTEHEAYSA
jgi:hypothetical protein